MEHHSSLSRIPLLLLLCTLLVSAPVGAAELAGTSEDELQPGSFLSVGDQMVHVCYYAEVTLMDLVTYTPATGGCGAHRMKVLRYGYDAQGDPYVIDTLRLNRPEDNFDSWLEMYQLRTDTSGTFSLRTFVRDEGCTTDWVPNEGEFKYVVLPKFSAGSIVAGHDTAYLKNGQVSVSISALTPASGGDGNYSYKWKKFENDIPKAKSEDLVNHIVKADEFTWPKTIKFKRWAKDASRCGNAQSEGIYQLTVFEELNPGAIENNPDLVFCTAERAKTYTITATPATGGSKKYLYQWFIQDGTTLTPIEGATECNLQLSKVNIVEGTDYTFVRKVKDDTRFTEWMLSDNQQVIGMRAKPEVRICESEACACNGQITLYYELISGEVDMYSVEFSPKLAAAIGKSGVIDYIGEPNIPNTIVIPDIPQLPDGEYTMNVRLGISCEAKSLEEVDCYSEVAVVKLVNGLDGYVKQKFERMLVVDNQPDNDYPLAFKEYKWYKNGQPLGSTKQFYYEADGSKLNGSYFARLVGVDGKSYRSCSIHQISEEDSDESQVAERTIYPAPAKAGQPVMIQSGEAEITVYTCTGELVQTTRTAGEQSTIVAPQASGLYFIQLRHADGSLLTEKLIVK